MSNKYPMRVMVADFLICLKKYIKFREKNFGANDEVTQKLRRIYQPLPQEMAEKIDISTLRESLQCIRIAVLKDRLKNKANVSDVWKDLRQSMSDLDERIKSLVKTTQGRRL